MLPTPIFRYVETKDNIEIYKPDPKYILRINTIHLETGTIYEDNVIALYKTNCFCYEIKDSNNRFQPFRIYKDGSIVVTDSKQYMLAEVKVLSMIDKYSVLVYKDENYNVVPCKDLVITKINQEIECISLDTKNSHWMLDNGIFVMKSFIDSEQFINLRIVNKQNIKTKEIEAHITDLKDVEV